MGKHNCRELPCQHLPAIPLEFWASNLPSRGCALLSACEPRALQAAAKPDFTIQLLSARLCPQALPKEQPQLPAGPSPAWLVKLPARPSPAAALWPGLDHVDALASGASRAFWSHTVLNAGLWPCNFHQQQILVQAIFVFEAYVCCSIVLGLSHIDVGANEFPAFLVIMCRTCKKSST